MDNCDYKQSLDDPQADVETIEHSNRTTGEADDEEEDEELEKTDEEAEAEPPNEPLVGQIMLACLLSFLHDAHPFIDIHSSEQNILSIDVLVLVINISILLSPLFNLSMCIYKFSWRVSVFLKSGYFFLSKLELSIFVLSLSYHC